MPDNSSEGGSFGPERLDEVSSRNFADREHVIPFTFEELEREAVEHVDEEVAGFITAGAGRGDTKDANREAFARWRLLPRVLRGATDRDLGVEVLGTRLPAPVLLAPVGGQGVVHDEGELATARGASKVGVPAVFSSFSSFPMEEIAAEMGETPRWFQLYMSTDDDLNESLVDRAEAAGFDAIVITVDTPIRGWRPGEIREGFSVFERSATGFGNYFSDPAFLRNLDPLTRVANRIPYAFESVKYLRRIPAARRVIEERGKRAQHVAHSSSATWDDVEEIRDATSLPVVLKGILHPEDAEMAAERGFDGVVVSNHGGNHVDSAVASLDALPEIVDRVGDRLDVLFDSGIRTGTDVFKAMALGADAVLLGRPFLYGLAVAGDEGVYEAVANVLAELDVTMGNAGRASVDELDESCLVEAPDVTD